MGPPVYATALFGVKYPNMRAHNSAEARQLKQLLQEKLIPLAQNGAPLILFDAPPRSSQAVDIRQEITAPLPALKKNTSYPQIHDWPDAGVNAITVPVLGCIFDGEADYDVRTPPGKTGRRWIVPVKQGTLFLVKPGIPFTSSKLAWERSSPQNAYARGVLMHLRHDGVRCHTFTMDRGKLWGQPYLFLYQPEVLYLGEKLLEEMRQMDHSVQPITYYYWLLIFHLLLRGIQQGRFATTASRLPEQLEEKSDPFFSTYLTSERRVRLAEEYIQNHLGDLGLRHAKIAQHSGLSSRHLERLFLAGKGISLSDYIMQQKLEKACDLLQSSHIPISEVAEYCGFKHRSNFSSWFTRQMKCSPSSYREEQTESKK
jgi:AraC-like DNA-binding protein